jgi:hypothetical protein
MEIETNILPRPAREALKLIDPLIEHYQQTSPTCKRVLVWPRTWKAIAAGLNKTKQPLDATYRGFRIEVYRK